MINKRICLVLPLILLMWGCTSKETDLLFEPKESDKLTGEEINVLIYHAQQFIGRSKKVKLTESDRAMVMRTRPQVRIRYSAKKFGRLEFDWRLTPKTVLHLTSYGHLRENKQNWRLEIKTMVESNPVPDNFLKVKMDTLALPPQQPRGVRK